MAKKKKKSAKPVTVAAVRKRNPQDATRKKDVAPIRRRVDAVEARLDALETWAAHVFNPDTAPTSFAPKVQE